MGIFNKKIMFFLTHLLDYDYVYEFIFNHMNKYNIIFFAVFNIKKLLLDSEHLIIVNVSRKLEYKKLVMGSIVYSISLMFFLKYLHDDEYAYEFTFFI